MAEEALELRVLERLYLCLGEVSGVYRAVKGPPVTAVPDTDLPLVYPIVKGTVEDTRPSQGRIQVVRPYLLRCLISPVDQGSETPLEGSEAYWRAVPMLSAFYRYFGAHPELQTDGESALAGCVRTALRDTGVVVRQGPGGAQYVAVEPVLTVVMTEDIRDVATMRL